MEATSKTVDIEQFAVGYDATPRVQTRRVVADPMWAISAAVLVTLDAVAVGALSASLWLTLIVVVISAALGSYRHRHTLTLSEGDGRYLILTAALATPMITLDEPAGSDVLFVLEVLGALLLSRVVGFAIVGRLRRWFPRPVFVAGSGPVARDLVRALTEHREYGLTPRALVTDTPVADIALPTHSYADAFVAMHEAGALGLLCAFGPEPHLELHRLVREAEADRRRVWVVPRMFDLSPRRDHIWGIAIAIVHRPPLYNPMVRLAKRVIDVVVASLALVLLSPLLVLIALVVRTTSRGPVLYRQRRVGLHGREFTMLKFRTMRSAPGDSESADWTSRDDPRRTPAGRLLRRTSLDELPQLVNVIRGNMSLVGPRPEQRAYAETFAEDLPTYPERTRAVGGITGLAQVEDLRGDTPIDERVRFDNRYIDQYSLFLDAVIAVKTIGSLFRSKHAY